MKQSSSFVKYQPFQLHFLYQEFQLDKLLHNGEEDAKSKRRRTSCVQVATSSDESIFFYCEKFLRRIESDSTKSPGMPIASGRPDSRMSVEASSSDAASPQVSFKDAYLGGLMEKQRRNPSHQEEDSEDSDNREAGTWYYKEESVAPKKKAWDNQLYTEPLLLLKPGKSKEHGSDEGPPPSNIAGHIAPHGSRLLHGQDDLWKTTRRSYGRFECEFVYLENVHGYHSSSSSSSRKRL